MTNRFTFFDTGFHGDKYLLEIFDELVERYNPSLFVETGTNVGTTLAYVADKNPDLACLSCETDQHAYEEAVHNTKKLSNAIVSNTDSKSFLKNEVTTKYDRRINVIFWIDAHGYGFKWPLKEEIDIITEYFKNPLILIDDFKVPHIQEFIYDEYDGQTCSYEYIKSSINGDYNIYYPNYKEHTSNHHPLKGWGLLSKNNISIRNIVNGQDV